MKTLKIAAILATILLAGMPAPAAAQAPVSLSGSITNESGAPICGLVLANGVFMFSCSPVGSYSLAYVPLDAQGKITLYGFAEDHYPYKTVLSGSTATHDIALRVAGGTQETNRDKTERLVGGTWSLSYTLGSSFTRRYTFTSVQPSAAFAGDYDAFGTDEFGGQVFGTYLSILAQWAILDPGTSFDRFFIFTFQDLNRVSGCYHQLTPSGSTNLGSCYAMTGSRFPAKSLGQGPVAGREAEEALEALADGAFAGPPDTEALGTYLIVRERMRKAQGGR